MENETLILMWLKEVRGIGNIKALKIMDAVRGLYGSNEKLWDLNISDILSLNIIDLRTTKDLINRRSRGRFENDIKNWSEKGIDVINYYSSRYPEPLRQIYDPPSLLYTWGKLSLVSIDNGIAVVGSRTPTAFGIKAAEDFTRGLALSGVTIISGLAEGIDTVAHRVCIENGGSTVAVLGSGIDIVYPIINRKIYESIKQKGLIVSEYPPGSSPIKSNFPKRNRIISALASGTLLVEAGSKSGSLITAELTIEQGRELFVVPGSIYSPKYFGSNRLIRNGANLVTSHIQIIDQVFGNADLKNMDKVSSGYSGLMKKILEVLTASAGLSLEEICRSTCIERDVILEYLLVLLLDGVIRKTEEGLYMSSL